MVSLSDTLERQVLGACLQDAQAVAEVEAVLQPEDFSDPRLETLFRAILDLAHAGEPTDPIAVGARLAKEKAPGGDWEPLAWTLQSEVATWTNAGYYADKVRELATRRRLAMIGRQIAERAAMPDMEPERLRQDAVDALDGFLLPGRRTAFADVAEMNDREFDRLASPSTYLLTPWPALNAYIDGWRPGALYVVGARTAQGKTTMGLQVAAFLSTSGWAAYLSVEMDRHELYDRLLANAADVPLAAIHRHNLTSEQWERAAGARSKILALNLRVIDGPYKGLLDLRRQATTLRREKGSLSGIVVDYLGLMLEGGTKDRWERMAELTGNLKALARELQVPVIALSQLNRNSANGDRPPALSDLRDGGSVEQDADVVLLLQRDDDDARGQVMKVNVAKNRHGRAGEFELLFEGPVSRLTSM